MKNVGTTYWAESKEIDQELIENFGWKLQYYGHIIRSLNTALSTDIGKAKALNKSPEEREETVKKAENGFVFALETVIDNLKAEIRELEDYISTIAI